MNTKRNINIFLVSLIFIFAIISGWGFSRLYNNKEADNHIDTSFNLINHLGDKVSNKNYINYKKVFFFGFTYCPDVCPMGVSVLSNVIDGIESKSDSDDYRFIFVSVDPDRDTPKRLNRYLSNFNEKIIGLTGNYEMLKPVWENFFVHVKSNITPNQGSYSELDKLDKENSHETLDTHSHSHEEETVDNSYIVQHSAFYFIFDSKDNLKKILPFGSSSEDILLELTKF